MWVGQKREKILYVFCPRLPLYLFLFWLGKERTASKGKFITFLATLFIFLLSINLLLSVIPPLTAARALDIRTILVEFTLHLEAAGGQIDTQKTIGSLAVQVSDRQTDR